MRLRCLPLLSALIACAAPPSALPEADTDPSSLGIAESTSAGEEGGADATSSGCAGETTSESEGADGGAEAALTGDGDGDGDGDDLPVPPDADPTPLPDFPPGSFGQCSVDGVDYYCNLLPGLTPPCTTAFEDDCGGPVIGWVPQLDEPIDVECGVFTPGVDCDMTFIDRCNELATSEFSCSSSFEGECQIGRCRIRVEAG